MNSPYPELKALSDEERERLIERYYNAIKDAAELKLSTYEPLRLKAIELSIDKIKQLVLTRGTNEK